MSTRPVEVTDTDHSAPMLASHPLMASVPVWTFHPAPFITARSRVAGADGDGELLGRGRPDNPSGVVVPGCDLHGEGVCPGLGGGAPDGPVVDVELIVQLESWWQAAADHADDEVVAVAHRSGGAGGPPGAVHP